MSENNLNAEPVQSPAAPRPESYPIPPYQAPTNFALPHSELHSSPKSNRGKRLILPVALAVAGLLVGAGIGYANRPAPVVEVQTKTETKTVDVVPSACVDAIDQADTGFANASQVITYMSDAIQGAKNLDVAAISKANSSLDTLTPQLTEVMNKYRAARDSCRASR